MERFNHYLKNNFLLPLKVSLREISLEIDVSYANAHIEAWLKDVAHQRIHGTTNATPKSRLNEEEAHLLPLPVEFTINDRTIRSKCLILRPFQKLWITSSIRYQYTMRYFTYEFTFKPN